MALLGALLLALVYAYASPLWALLTVWRVSPMYSYGYTVPFIAVYLLWTRRHALAALAPQPARTLGGSLLLTGVALLVAGRAGGITVAQQLAFLVSLGGAVTFLLGRGYARLAWPALAYLLFMVPIWELVTEPLHQPFQDGSAGLAVGLLRTVGIPAFRDGTVIELPRISLEVARSCSGVNYLVAIVAIGVPLGYVYLSAVWRRVLLIVAAIAVAGAFNGLRVALIATLAHLEIGSPIHGPAHVLHGLVVSVAGYVALFAALRALMPNGASAPRAAEAVRRASVRPTVPRLEWAVLLALFVSTGYGIRAVAPGSVSVLAGLQGGIAIGR